MTCKVILLCFWALFSLVCCSAEKAAPVHHRVSLLPQNKSQIILSDPLPLGPKEWILYLRIQKTASKGWTSLLKKIGNIGCTSKTCEKKCNHEFMTSISPEAKQKRCTKYKDCAKQLPVYLHRAYKDRNVPQCRVLSDQHCDLADLIRPFSKGPGQVAEVKPTNLYCSRFYYIFFFSGRIKSVSCGCDSEASCYTLCL